MRQQSIEHLPNLRTHIWWNSNRRSHSNYRSVQKHQIIFFAELRDGIMEHPELVGQVLLLFLVVFNLYMPPKVPHGSL